MINLSLDGSVQTLILTLRARAEEQKQASPLLDDKWSADWYGFMPEDDTLDDWYNPTFQLATAIRSSLIDEAVNAFLESHEAALVVELGAGFSTRYFRVGKGRSTWVELDLEEAIIARRKIDIEVEKHWFIPADMTDTEAWLGLLPERDAENVLLIAEGTLMFLEADKVKTMFNTLAKAYKGAQFVFDVVNPGYIDAKNEQFEAINAPMQWGITLKDLGKYPISIDDTRYLLLEHADRWDAIGVDSSKRTEDRSGYIVAATLG
ncbi:MAG: class I SAM-dependent methyltransferase [Chloroflexota bacterium]